MVQEMNILRCYSCHMYQVHIVKKANKWQCKICNEKQSVQHVYYQGSGQDCRLHVQRLNLKNHIEEQRLDELAKLEGVNEHSPAVAIRKPVFAGSKWTKYMIPQTEYHEIEQNHVKDYRIDEKFCCENSMDGRETGKSFFSKDNASENSVFIVPTCDATNVPIFETASTRNLQHRVTLDEESNLNKNTEKNVSLAQKSDLSPIANKSSSKLVGGDICNQSSSSNYNCESIKKKQSIVVIRKHVKRKAGGENVVPEAESGSLVFDWDSSDKIYKRSNILDGSLWQKKSLRDIVELNRSNAGKSINFKAKAKSFTGLRNESVLKEINNSHNVDTKETEIVKTELRKKTIFETECDELEEILDF